ncbi:chloride channel protein [Solicola gregarius]|uniref:Chloride channel protein n=1 Tax=Solicola gregarius TaxID=2908642 RepID=A0AA46YJF5_9ACTN|nr:chloride channel protein [Solicola gregarius]UYM03416.1 chloride channel protein [Solicola gregarius]
MEQDAHQGQTQSESELVIALHSRGYVAILLVAALIGIPLSFVAFFFLVVVHELEHLVWDTLPDQLGFDGVPAWWPIVTMGLAAVVVGLTISRLPGHGGHVPADGMGAGGTPPRELPGTIIAAAVGLSLGAVLGPEAPLMALGSGLALLAVSRTRAADRPQVSAVIGAAGSAAAISAVFGNPLVAAIIFLEVADMGRRRTTMLVLPALVASGVGAVVFTGLGSWTGLEIGALTIPDLESSTLNAATVAWTLPVAAAIAAGIWAALVCGRRVASLATAYRMRITVAAGLVTGLGATIYALVTDHGPEEVVLSGQATLGDLALHPEQWSAGALVLLLVCKGIGYGVCLGAFRGGLIFPAVFLGAAAGVLASTALPGIDPVAGVAIGTAAATAATQLPVTGILLVVLLMGDAAASQMPVIILSAVTALVVDELLNSLTASDPDSPATT